MKASQPMLSVLLACIALLSPCSSYVTAGPQPGDIIEAPEPEDPPPEHGKSVYDPEVYTKFKGLEFDDGFDENVKVQEENDDSPKAPVMPSYPWRGGGHEPMALQDPNVDTEEKTEEPAEYIMGYVDCTDYRPRKQDDDDDEEDEIVEEKSDDLCDAVCGEEGASGGDDVGSDDVGGEDVGGGGDGSSQSNNGIGFLGVAALPLLAEAQDERPDQRNRRRTSSSLQEVLFDESPTKSRNDGSRDHESHGDRHHSDAVGKEHHHGNRVGHGHHHGDRAGQGHHHGDRAGQGHHHGDRAGHGHHHGDHHGHPGHQGERLDPIGHEDHHWERLKHVGHGNHHHAERLKHVHNYYNEHNTSHAQSDYDDYSEYHGFSGDQSIIDVDDLSALLDEQAMEINMRSCRLCMPCCHFLQLREEELAAVAKMQFEDECSFDAEENDFVAAECRTCHVRRRPPRHGVTLTCYECARQQADRTCRVGPRNEEMQQYRVSAKFFLTLSTNDTVVTATQHSKVIERRPIVAFSEDIPENALPQAHLIAQGLIEPEDAILYGNDEEETEGEEEDVKKTKDDDKQEEEESQ